MVQAEVKAEALVHDASSARVGEYCYTAVNIFDAASAGWDPISSDHDLGPLSLGSELEQNLAGHIVIARKTIFANHTGDTRHTSFEFLEEMFEMDKSVRVRRRRVTTKAPQCKDSTSTTHRPTLSTANAKLAPEFCDSENGANTDHCEQYDSETEFPFPPPPLPPPRFIPMPVESWEGWKSFTRGTGKRRATSPPQHHDDLKRLSIDSFSQGLSAADDVSDRANSISSVNSFSSINAAYRTLALDSPSSGLSPSLLSRSPRSNTPDNMQQFGMPQTAGNAMSTRPRADSKNTGARRLQCSHTCDCCQKDPQKFEDLHELV